MFLSKPALDAEVIVVGAGWSGMSAAHHLAQHGVTFKVLEARNYTGGRTHSIQFGSDSVGKFTMEIGSGWLESSAKSGGPEKGIPPVAGFANAHKLKTVFVPGSTQNMSNYGHVYAPGGKDCDADGSIRNKANKAYACIGKRAAHTKAKNDVTVRQALEDCDWTPKSECELAVDWALTVDDPGMIAKDQMLSLTLPDQVYEWWGPDDHYVVDQRPRGYAGALDEMVKDTVPPGDDRVIFNTKVTEVAYDDNGVTISTENGQTYHAKAAITTFPLGVLNRQHRQLFKPNLPDKLANILDGGTFVMSNLTRVYLQFPTVFWNDNDRAFLTSGPDGPGEFAEFRNLDKWIPGSKILLNFLGNPESVKYENMSDEEVKAAAVKRLRSIWGDKVPEPTAFYMTRWGLDPLAFGCYSAFKPGFNDDFYKQITKPLPSKKNPRVYLAGEAMCDDLSGSVYGAYQSGREVALDYLYSTGKVSNKPKNLCWW